MPNYRYQCSSCGAIFDKYQSIHDSPLVSCPSCDENSLLRVFTAVPVLDATPRTIGALADKNTTKLGNYGREDLWQRQKEEKKDLKKKAIEALMPKLPGTSFPTYDP
jgi:putative FmdB family regulatory protein